MTRTKKQSCQRKIFVAWAMFASFGCGGTEDAAEPQTTTPPPQQVRRVEVAELTASKPRLDLRLPGEVKGSRDSVLGVPSGGYVERVLKEVGDKVSQGESIAWIDKTIHDAQLAQTAAQFEQAEKDWARVERAGASVSQARRQAAESAVKVAQAAHRAAQSQASRAAVRAPFDGVLAQKWVEVGMVVPPGGPVVRLVQLDPVKVNVTLSDRDVVALEPGLPVRVTTQASGKVWSGTISTLSPAADLETRAFSVDLVVPNPEGELLPGMIAFAHIDKELEQEGVTLPQHVLVTRRDGNGVFVVENEKAVWKPLTIGQVIGDQIAIASGLNTGEQVVTTGQRQLLEGDAVSVMRRGTCCKQGRIVFATDPASAEASPKVPDTPDTPKASVDSP